MRAVREIVSAALVLFVCLATAGVLKRLHAERIDSALLKWDSGLAVVMPVDVDGDREGRLYSELELFEDDKPLGPAHALHTDIRRDGGGRYCHWDHKLYFSASDSSDPRRNRRIYWMRYPIELPAAWSLAAFALLCALQRRRVVGLVERLDRLNPAWLALAVAVAGLAVRVWTLAMHHDETLESLVKGVPISDGMRWEAMSSDFARGWKTAIEWDDRRPFRWIFNGAIFALSAPRLLITQGAQIVMGAASGVLLFEAVRRLAPMTIALMIAGAHALSTLEASYDLLPGCEALGAFLALAFLYLFVLAAMAPERRWPWLAAGVTLGLTDLTRPELMGAMVAMPLALGWILTRDEKRIAPARAWIGGLALFGAGLALVVGPWMLRQHAKYGTWSISGNSSEVLFAASSPEYHGWSPEVAALGEALPVRERIAFFDEKLRESMREHWSYYLRTSIENTALVAGNLVDRAPLAIAVALLTGLALGAATDRRRRTRPLVVGALLLALILVVPEPLLSLLALCGLLLAAIVRAPMLLYAAWLAPVVVAIGFSGVTLDPRLQVAWHVAAIGLAIWFCGVLLGVPTEPEGAPGWGRARRPVARGCLIVAGLLLVGLAKATIATAIGSTPAAATLSDGARWIDAALTDPAAAPYRPLRRCLEARLDWIPPEYLMRFRAGEAVSHWNPLFRLARAYATSMFQTFPAPWDHRRGDVLYGVWPGDAPPPLERQLVLVGMRVDRPNEGTSFETVALGELAGGAAQLQHPETSAARAHAEELALVCAQRR